MLPDVKTPLESGEYSIRITLTDDNKEFGPEKRQYVLILNVESEAKAGESLVEAGSGFNGSKVEEDKKWQRIKYMNATIESISP